MKIGLDEALYPKSREARWMGKENGVFAVVIDLLLYLSAEQTLNVSRLPGGEFWWEGGGAKVKSVLSVFSDCQERKQSLHRLHLYIGPCEIKDWMGVSVRYMYLVTLTF